LSRETLGLFLGVVGVAVFAGTLPFTRLAVAGLDPWFVTAGRAAVSGVIAAAVLLILRRPVPDRASRGPLILASVCVVGVFPVSIAFAMRTVDASHGGVVLGILPLATAVLAAWRTGERPALGFWLAAFAGAALVVGFALYGGGGRLQVGDLLLAAAVASSALGYVISGQLTGRYAAWEVISWELAIALPVTLPVALWFAPAAPSAVPAWSWIGFAYVALMSQYLGFFAWNAGLAMGGISRVSQVQLVQTFFTLGIAAVINGETVGPSTWAVAAAVVLLIAIGRRSAIRRT
jgi:drug/metabolite transporter (DMT)-like permease